MIKHADTGDQEIRSLVRHGFLRLAGNRSLKIYGSLRCTSGRRMKRSNRVFFRNAAEAEALGYRPCGHCQRALYKKWKHETIRK